MHDIANAIATWAGNHGLDVRVSCSGMMVRVDLPLDALTKARVTELNQIVRKADTAAGYAPGDRTQGWVRRIFVPLGFLPAHWWEVE